MAKITKIQWTEASWNPWQGCEKVSTECAHCYMFTAKKRFGQNPAIVRRSSEETFRQPLRWKVSKLIFTCSWSDFFHPDADAWRSDAWDIIRQTPRHTYQILTKRPERIAGHLPSEWPLENVWLGVTVGMQRFIQRISFLAATPVHIRFVSVEPLLGLLNLSGWLRELDWVIIGGESGLNARPMQLDWARQIIQQCRDAKKPVFVKQLGTSWAKTTGVLRKGNTKGEIVDLWPLDLRIQEYPDAHRKGVNQEICKN